MGDMTPESILAIGIVIFLAIGIHEYAHAKLADMAGDPTPRYYGRVTLNLIKHFEPLGTIMIVITSMTGFGIGWGKPVPMDPSKMRNPRWDHFIAVLAGPLSNLVQAMVWAVFLRLVAAGPEVPTFVSTLLFMGVLINLSLMTFNLIPLGPLDGQWILGSFLPERLRYGWTRFNLQYGGILLLILVFMGQLGGFPLLRMIIMPVVIFFFRLLTGQ
jgi:Zn-dependent protease